MVEKLLEDIRKRGNSRKEMEIGKAIPLQAWKGSKDSRNLRLPYFKAIGTKKVVSLTALRTGHL